MKIMFSDHAKKRMRQRGVEDWEIEHILKHPDYIKKSFEGRRIAVGEIKNRKLGILYIKQYLRMGFSTLKLIRKV